MARHSLTHDPKLPPLRVKLTPDLAHEVRATITYTRMLFAGTWDTWSYTRICSNESDALAHCLLGVVQAAHSQWKIHYKLEYSDGQLSALLPELHAVTLDFMVQPEIIRSRTKGQRPQVVRPAPLVTLDHPGDLW